MAAGEEDYDGISYADLLFAGVDRSLVDGEEHDPARRAERKGTTEQNVLTEWATEACQDERRWVRSAKSRFGLTVKVTGYSPTAAFVVTVVVAPKDTPPDGQWWRGRAKSVEIRSYEEGR